MKKLMTSTIILLPLIILAILLVSGAIKALTNHIYVDYVEFVDDDTLVLVMDDEENPPAEQLEVNVLPLQAENRGLIFSMDDENIATVDASGKVVAKFYGETYINVMSAEDNLKKDRRRVLVTDDAVHKIEIAKDHPTDMYEANTEQLAVVIYPREAKEGRVKWTTSNPEILAISETGIIKARGYGEATITATSVENEEIFDSVTIKCHSAIDGIKTESGVSRVETALETARFPKITKSPLEADVTIAYTSDDPDVAKVDENGLITFLKAGKVTITATATDFGNTQASASVEYVSTLHYYRLPIFEKKMYTVDFDEYYDANQNIAKKPLEIPFAAGFEPENTNRQIKNVEFSISSKKVLEFDEAKEAFYFVGEMPDGTSDIRVTVTAEIYDTETNELTEKTDAFTLTVQRKAKSIAVGYNGTENAQSIVLSDKTLIFGTDSDATASVSVFPSNHTDKLSYALENAEGTATLSGGTLTFQKAGTVDVLVSCKYDSGEAHAQSRIKVSYAPVSEREHTTGIEIKPAEGEQRPAKQQVLLSMDGDTKEQGVLYFAEPADSTVTYAVVDEKNAAVELTEENGVQHIVPKKGGFATVTITVSPRSAAAIALFSAPRNGEPKGTTVYTVEIYVDKHVSAEDLSVQLNGKSAEDPLFGATGTSVSFRLDVDEKESAMAGKVLYVTYSGLSVSADGTENSKTMSGSITFPENINSLEVTFGVKYSAKARELGAKGTLPAVKRTLKRNAESITFRYRDTDVDAITTTRNSLTFKTVKAVNDTEVYVKIGPDNHTDTPEYFLAEEQSGASITSQGVLTFADNKPCTVTVQIRLRGLDGKISDTYTIKVNYAPRSEGDTVITLPADGGNKFLLSMTDTAKIDYVVPAGATVDCTSQNKVVSVAEKNGEWTIMPQKGGFDTVTFKVNDTAYTFYVYVDRTVANDFTVELGGTTVASRYYSTAQDAVPFTVTVHCEEGAMAGKQIYVKYGETTLTGKEGETTFTGNGEEIGFAGLATLPVTFGVQYAENANEYGKTGELGVSASRTIARNATDITFSYKGTTVSDVTITSSKLTFKTSKTVVAGEVYVELLPANHTDTVKYSLTGSDATIDATSGELNFTKADEPCTVTVQIQLVGMDGKDSVSKEIKVNYVPRDKQDKVVELPADDHTALNLLLFMNGSGTVKDKGKIVYVVPAGAEIECTSQNDVVSVAEEDGEWTITPQKGGFGAVKYKVTGENLNKEYTVNVYVNRAVTADKFEVTLQDTAPAEGVYGTTAAAVSFEVTVNCEEGAMEGKQIYVKYNGQTKATGAENTNTLSGTIDFAELATLEVTFGVEYADSTSAYEPDKSDDVALSSVTRTLARNAESITVTYGKVATAKIVTKEAAIDFNGKVTVAPQNHTDTTIAYVLENGADIATIDGSKLTFRQAGTATVQVQTKRGETVTLTKSFTVTYEPLGDNAEIKPGTQTETKNIAMSLGKDGLIYYTVPENATVTYEVSGEGVIDGSYKHGADDSFGVYHITPRKGGLATVTVKVNGQNIDETHTFNIYVNVPVASDDITVKFGGKECAQNASYGTKGTAVSFEVTVNCAEGAMVGKQLYVEYNNGQSKRLTATADQTTYTDTIEFSGDLGSLTVTFGVEYASETAKYSDALKGIAFGATTTRTLGRDAQSIAVRYADVETEKIVTHDSIINFQEDLQIVVEPANHTDTFAYELEGGGNGIAEVAGGELKFTGSGTVTLIIKTVRNGTETCSKTIAVTYEPLGGNKEITLDTDTQYVVLKYGSEEGRIYFTVPKDAAVTYTVTKGDNKVITADGSSGVYHIVPRTGGFATLTVTVADGGADATYTINIYVDAPVTLNDFSVKFNNAVYAEGVEFKTSKTNVAYIFAVTNNNSSREGKEVHVEVNNEAHGTPLSWNHFTQNGTFQFDGEKTEYTFVFSVRYTSDVADYGPSGIVNTADGTLARTQRTVITTNGKLNAAPKVTYDGGELQTGDNATALAFANIDEEITFTVDKASFDPADFQLSAIELQNITDGVAYVELGISGSTFTLTAKKSTNEQTIKYRLNIGSQLFTLNITIKAKAQEIQVTCGKTVLGDGQKYKTLLGELTFTVKAGRLDGEPVTDPSLEYKADGMSDWQPFENGQCTLSGLEVDGSIKGVEFRTTDDSGVSFRLLVERVQLTDFSMEVRVDLGDGNAPIAIGREKSVLEADGTLQYVLPARMTGTVALYIVADGEYLGGFGTDVQFKEIIPAQWQSVGWTIEHTLISTGNERLPHANINLVLPSEIGESALVEIGGGVYCRPQCTIQFTSGTSLAWIEFPGFDGNNSADVYKGYQQVRVFAKHSDYGDGNLVDYYRVPVAAYKDVADMQANEMGKKDPLTDLSVLNWKLTSYTDDAATEDVVITQTGRDVTYNGRTYKIVGDADAVMLQFQSADGAATTIVNANGTYADGQPHVPWVDTVSEAAEGYVRVYFGDFVGLSESDVQNDLFGNFGEKKGWSKSDGKEDIKGDPITPSSGAFSFLRLEGGDGAVGGVNAHFNFNVLQDPDSNAANNLVNVFDANGYYAHTSIVLQENLYGEGELTGEEKMSAEAEEKGLYLKETGNLGKTLLYGNGYQVNLEAFNASIVADMNSHPNNYPNGYNESRAVTFKRAYNAVIKGSNPKDELSGKIQTTNLHMAYAYYCDLSYYYKFNPDGNTFYAKNTVFSCIPKTAVQLYYDNLTMYAENIVMTECGTSIQADNTSQQKIKIYYKGSIDILNYFNQPMLSNMNALVGSFFGEVVPNVKDYFEWHGQNIEANASSLSGADKIYVNILAFAASDLSDKVFVWNGGKYTPVGSATLDNGSKIVSKTLVDYFSYHYYAATYEMVDADGRRLDNATINFANNKFTGKADLNNLFEGDRIRLQCQFKDVGVKNYEHIKWHKQEVYRDKSLLEGRKTHSEDLRDSLKNTQWADGSYVDGGGAIHAAAELASLISETVIPSKRTY